MKYTNGYWKLKKKIRKSLFLVNKIIQKLSFFFFFFWPGPSKILLSCHFTNHLPTKIQLHHGVVCTLCSLFIWHITKSKNSYGTQFYINNHAKILIYKFHLYLTHITFSCYFASVSWSMFLLEQLTSKDCKVCLLLSEHTCGCH